MVKTVLKKNIYICWLSTHSILLKITMADQINTHLHAYNMYSLQLLWPVRLQKNKKKNVLTFPLYSNKLY